MPCGVREPTPQGKGRDESFFPPSHYAEVWRGDNRGHFLRNHIFLTYHNFCFIII